MRARIACALCICIAPALASAGDEQRERDEATLKEAGVNSDGPALLEFFRQRTPSTQQQQEIADLIKQLGSDSFAARRKAAARLEGFGLPAIGLLKRALDSGDPEVARQSGLILKKVEKVPTETVAAAAARMLGRIKPPGAVDTILQQLPVADDEYVADSLRASLAELVLKDGKPEEKIVAALGDKEPARRGAAGEALIKVKALGVEPEVRKLLKDSDAEVRLRVALALVKVARAKDVVPELIELLPSAPRNRVWLADEVLRHLAGEDAPNVSPFGTDADRVRARDAWAAWWKNNGERVDLARLDKAPPFLGYTLVLKVNPNTGQGEAVELAPDGKTVRWRIPGLQQPVDGQYLPGVDHLLVAEHDAGAVNERDLNGKIVRHWVANQPVGCQRLPDGNTLIVHRDGFTEYNARDEVLFTHARNMRDIVAGRKDRDGSYVFLTRNGTCERIDNKGKTLKSFNVGRTYVYASLELLPNNRVLVSHMTGVGEYDLTTGKREASISAGRNITSATRLPNGNTLVTSITSSSIIEFDREGKRVKESRMDDGSIPWRIKQR